MRCTILTPVRILCHGWAFVPNSDVVQSSNSTRAASALPWRSTV
jgi:hypothetical protein